MDGSSLRPVGSLSDFAPIGRGNRSRACRIVSSCIACSHDNPRAVLGSDVLACIRDRHNCGNDVDHRGDCVTICLLWDPIYSFKPRPRDGERSGQFVLWPFRCLSNGIRERAFQWKSQLGASLAFISSSKIIYSERIQVCAYLPPRPFTGWHNAVRTKRHPRLLISLTTRRCAKLSERSRRF